MSSLAEMQIRRARTGDHDRMVDVWERSVRATHGFLTEVDIVALRPLVAAELKGADIEWWVLAAAGDEAIGFLGYSPHTIEGLFLDPAHRGAGGGSALVAHAQRLSGEALSVDVNAQNDTARGFYEALGFVVVASSPTDGAGRPFPILHMRRSA
jgi:putative acetyltransferase